MPLTETKDNCKEMVTQKADILVRDMNMGDIGVITQWGEMTFNEGKIVQRWLDHLIILGTGDGWEYWFSEPVCEEDQYCRVLIISNSGCGINRESI